MTTRKPKTWATLSESAKAYFFGSADWDQHFEADIIAEAKEYYAMLLEPGEYGRGGSASAAWHYAQGASRSAKPEHHTP